MTDAVDSRNAKQTKLNDKGVLKFLLRFLLLCAGGGLAWVAGVALANIYPSPTSVPPLFVKAWRGSKNWVNRTPTPSPIPTATSSKPLAPKQKEQLQAELKQLQLQLDQLRDRTLALETKLGSKRDNQPLETRFSYLSQQLQSATPAIAGDPKPSNPLTVTLPSDVLFKGDQTVLSENRVILDSVVNELRSYKGAAVLIAAHTDSNGEARVNRARSFRRAKAVEQYLSRILGDRYHLVSIGYGESRPLVLNDTQTNRQRNRRIEIAIDAR